MGGILLLSVWPIIGLELWGLRRSDRALEDFCHQGTPFCCHEGRPSPHCPPREGKRPTLREVRLPVPHLRVVFRPDRRQKQSFPRRAFGATHGARQSLTEGLGVRVSGTRLAIPCPVFLGLFPEASGRGPLQPLYTEASSPPRRSRREDRRLRPPPLTRHPALSLARPLLAPSPDSREREGNGKRGCWGFLGFYTRDHPTATIKA